MRELGYRENALAAALGQLLWLYSAQEAQIVLPNCLTLASPLKLAHLAMIVENQRRWRIIVESLTQLIPNRASASEIRRKSNGSRAKCVTEVDYRFVGFFLLQRGKRVGANL